MASPKLPKPLHSIGNASPPKNASSHGIARRAVVDVARCWRRCAQDDQAWKAREEVRTRPGEGVAADCVPVCWKKDE
eukprot:scaffold348_cov329-Pavlova_lutheri.AAC.8